MALPTISFVQSAIVLNGVTVPFGTANVAGNVILVLALQQNGSAASFSIADTVKNSYRSLGFLSNGVSGAGSAVGQLFCSLNINPGVNIVTVQADSGVPSAVAIHEISGVNAVDMLSSGSGAGNAQSSGSANISSPNEFLFGWEAGGQGVQLSVNGEAGWTTAQTDNASFLTQYQIVGTQGIYASTTTTSTVKAGTNHWISQIATLFFSPSAQPQPQGVSQASVGTLLYPNYNNIAWTQPGGKGTQVFPAQQRNAPFVSFPVPGQVIDEVGMSLWPLGCGHGVDVIRVFKDFDTDTQTQCAVIACSICSFIVSIVSPYENATSSIASWTNFPIIIP